MFEDILQSNGDVIIRRGFIAWLNRDRIRPEPCARRADAPGTVKAETNVLTDSIRVLATDDNADGYNHIIRGGETYSEKERTQRCKMYINSLADGRYRLIESYGSYKCLCLLEQSMQLQRVYYIIIYKL